MINLDYPDILNLFPEHLSPGRTESASFLIWYLENYYRLDVLEAVDSVCDKRGDKGVDGIYLNDSDETIDIFQSKISQRADSTIGDASLREFRGTLSQFKNRASVENLIATGGDSPVVRLVKRLDLADKVASYRLRGIFVANIDIDANGEAFLNTEPALSFVGKSGLVATYVSHERDVAAPAVAEFDISGFRVGQYIVDTNTEALIAPVKATELVALRGIQDQSLFAFNVRGPLGRTQVNRDIERSIKDPATHKLFPLFHNGITIICDKITETADRIHIENYYVVNGCQSLDSLYDNKATLTEDLRVLTKIVQVDVKSKLSENITRYSNNQNGVKARDFMSNNPVQIRLQNEFSENYPGDYWLEIKRGEQPGAGDVITNETAGLYLWAFDLKEPWATHRKYQVFEDKSAALFARPEVSADRILMCHVMMKAISEATNRLNNKLFAKYTLTRFMLLYMLRLILESDPIGKEAIADPQRFVRNPADRARFISCVNRIVNDIVVDVNGEVDLYGDDFDYRGKLRDEAWVKHLSTEVVGAHIKLVQRSRIPSFQKEWSS